MEVLKRVWHNKTKIIEGIMNSVIKTEEVEKIAAERMSVCNNCPDIDRTGDKCALPGTAPCCGLCGCKLSFKVRSLASACANEANPKWNALLSQEQEDEFYNKINYDAELNSGDDKGTNAPSV